MSNSRFEQICERFANGLALHLGYQTVQALGDEGWKLCGLDQSPDIQIYKREADLHRGDGVPPRVVLLAQGGQIISPDRVGPTKLDGAAVKVIRVRMFRIKVYCWGQNQEQSEDLLHNAMNAFQGTGSGSNSDDVNGAHNNVNFSDEVWEDQQPGAGGQETYGSQISFVATFAIVVTTKPQPIVRIAATHIHSRVTLLDDTEDINQ